ncbi:hypothetical protein, partial [Bradyrhizobium sp. SZCCHNR3027]
LEETIDFIYECQNMADATAKAEVLWPVLRAAAASAEPVAWVIPGDDNAYPDGSISAWAWQNGEFSKPLYTHPAPDAEIVGALERCRTVLGNMALENEGAIFNRWPINHEPLRNDARGLLPIIDAALAKAKGGSRT